MVRAPVASLGESTAFVEATDKHTIYFTKTRPVTCCQFWSRAN